MNRNNKPVNAFLVNPSKVAFALGTIALILVIASLVGQLMTYVLCEDFVSKHSHVKGLIKLFNLNQEGNAPTLFSFCLLLLSSILLFFITELEKRKRNPEVNKWLTLAFCFLYMASDEIFSFHEKLIIPVRTMMNTNHFGIFYYAWVIPGSIVVIIFLIYFFLFLTRLEPKIRRQFIIAAFLYLGGAIGMELAGGEYEESNGSSNMTYNLLVTLEESFEIAGIIVFIKGLLTYIFSHFKNVNFEMDEN